MSNIYPSWWDSSITIFNKSTDPVTKIVTWNKTVLDNCFWNNTGSQVSICETILDTESIVVRIPKSPNYKKYSEWKDLPNDVKVNYFTLVTGDIVVNGAIDDTIDEYQSGKRSSDLIKKYSAIDGCMQVKKVSINTQTGLINPHYLIKGI